MSFLVEYHLLPNYYLKDGKKKRVWKYINRTLITKLLGAETSENRIIAQSLSLFNSLGIEDDVRKEMVFVATNKVLPA